jgi:hypothetical protein
MSDQCTLLRLLCSDNLEIGVHLARLSTSPLLTDIVSDWPPGYVPCFIVPATFHTVSLLLLGGTSTEQEDR